VLFAPKWLAQLRQADESVSFWGLASSGIWDLLLSGICVICYMDGMSQMLNRRQTLQRWSGSCPAEVKEPMTTACSAPVGSPESVLLACRSLPLQWGLPWGACCW
jgi:hypothetical protein